MKDKALQYGESALGELENLVKVSIRPFKGDLAHTITMMLKSPSMTMPPNSVSAYIELCMLYTILQQIKYIE
jgi:hypothetical protein